MSACRNFAHPWLFKIRRVKILISLNLHWSLRHLGLQIVWVKMIHRVDNSNETGPAAVAQLDARPTGDQEVAGSTPDEVGNILSWRLIVKYFLQSFFPFR